jgi:DNA repair exonuclease SbcCD ATPase subunit
MITMQQLEELEARVIKALQLISDLRTENGRLDADNDSLKAQAEDARLSLEEKEQEIARIQKEMEATSRELAGIKEKEEILEKKIIELLGKLDVLKVGPTPIDGTAGFTREAPRARAAEAPKRPASRPAQKELSVESVKSAAKTGAAEKDEDIIIIDDEAGLDSPDVVVETVSENADEDEIILLDEGEDEIIIEDMDSDLAILDESEMESPRKKKSASAEAEGEDDFLIIEDDIK